MRKLTNSNVLVSYSEHIAIAKTTLGTETSKYQEEKKEKSMTLVVASETVTAQTNLLDWGCRTLYMQLQNFLIAEHFGKSGWKA